MSLTLPCDRHPVLNDTVPATAYGLPGGEISTAPLRLALSAYIDRCRACADAATTTMGTTPHQVVYAVVTSALTGQADTGRSVLDIYRTRVPIPSSYVVIERSIREQHGDNLVPYLRFVCQSSGITTVRAAVLLLAAALDDGKPVCWYPPSTTA